MPIGYRKGENKVIDDETGKEGFSGDFALDWDGSLRHKSNLDGEHPDYWEKRYPTEQFPEHGDEPVLDVYVTAATAAGEPVIFIAGTDVPRLLE